MRRHVFTRGWKVNQGCKKKEKKKKPGPIASRPVFHHERMKRKTKIRSLANYFDTQREPPPPDASRGGGISCKISCAHVTMATLAVNRSTGRWLHVHVSFENSQETSVSHSKNWVLPRKGTRPRIYVCIYRYVSAHVHIFSSQEFMGKSGSAGTTRFRDFCIIVWTTLKYSTCCERASVSVLCRGRIIFINLAITRTRNEQIMQISKDIARETIHTTDGCFQDQFQIRTVCEFSRDKRTFTFT